MTAVCGIRGSGVFTWGIPRTDNGRYARRPETPIPADRLVRVAGIAMVLNPALVTVTHNW